MCSHQMYCVCKALTIGRHELGRVLYESLAAAPFPSTVDLCSRLEVGGAGWFENSLKLIDYGEHFRSHYNQTQILFWST